MQKVCAHSHSKKLDSLSLDSDLSLRGACPNHLPGHPFVQESNLSGLRQASSSAKGRKISLFPNARRNRQTEPIENFQTGKPS